MLHFSTLLSLLFAIPIVTAAPTQVNKRIDQQDSAAVAKWEAACVSFHLSYNLQFT